MALIQGIECISIKEYAEKKGISVSAVTQSLHGKRNKALLEGHIIRESNNRGAKIWLDQEAVRILDANRRNNPVIVDSIESQKQHEQELKAKDDEIAELKERLKELAQTNKNMSEMLKAATTSKAMLEDKAAKVDQLTLQLTDSQNAVLVAENRAKELEGKVEGLKHRSLWQRIRNKDV